MKVLIVAPGAKPEEREIDGSLESMQTIVGGIIQEIFPFEDYVALICNDEGKLDCLPMNRMLWEINDVVCGTFFLCRALPNDAKLVKNEDNYTVELSWYDSHGTREVKNVSLEMPEENEELDVRSAVYTPLLSTYYSNAKVLLGRVPVGNDCIYRVDEIRLLLKVAEWDAVHIPIYLAVMFGLSMQEVLDLRWRDFNWHSNVLTVRNGMRMRMIRLCMEARDFLVKVHTWQKTHYRLSGSDGPAEDGFVCVDVDGIPFDAEEIERRLQDTIEKLDFRPGKDVGLPVEECSRFYRAGLYRYL